MIGKVKSMAIWLVLWFVCLASGSENWGAIECPHVVQYRVRGPFLLAHITASGPSRQGRVDFEFTYRVPLDKATSAEVELLSESDYNRHASTHEGELTYRVEFPFRDIQPAIVGVRLNGRLLCSSPAEVVPLTRIVTLTHSTRLYQRAPYSSPTSTTTMSKPEPTQKPTLPPPYTSYQFPPHFSDTIECGVTDIITRIHNGDNTARGDWPWSIPLFHLPQIVFQCGSTLVSQRHVITAAHCVVIKGVPLKSSEVTLKIGAHNLGLFQEAHSKFVTLASIVTHNDFNTKTYANDLAVLTTKESIMFSDYVKPICLWNGDPELSKVINQEAVVTGWGKTKTADVSNVLLELIVPIVSLEECRASHNLYEQIAVDNTLCAGKRDKRGPCNGDSGGGLFLFDENAGKWKLRGLVSASDEFLSQCYLTHFVLYTDLAQYTDWIQSQMN